jgi:hypothetical protein
MTQENPPCPSCYSLKVLRADQMEWDFDSIKIKVDWKFFTFFCPECRTRFGQPPALPEKKEEALCKTEG